MTRVSRYVESFALERSTQQKGTRVQASKAHHTVGRGRVSRQLTTSMTQQGSRRAGRSIAVVIRSP
jgi:hypothetical protein